MTDFSPVGANAPLPVDRYQLAGMAQVGRTAYQVYRMPVLPNTSKAGVRNQFALVGPRGATYLVSDHGPRYELVSVACGGGKPWAPAPRKLAGLQRSDLAAFGVEA